MALFGMVWTNYTSSSVAVIRWGTSIVRGNLPERRIYRLDRRLDKLPRHPDSRFVFLHTRFRLFSSNGHRGSVNLKMMTRHKSWRVGTSVSFPPILPAVFCSVQILIDSFFSIFCCFALFHHVDSQTSRTLRVQILSPSLFAIITFPGVKITMPCRVGFNYSFN